jgi:beta-mannanase
MTQSISRIAAFLAVMTIGIGLSLLFTIVGEKTTGPVSDLMTTVNAGISSLEKRFTTSRANRAEKLKWLDKYRNNTASITSIDRILLGAYDDRTAESYESIVALEDSLETKLPIISIYAAWGSRSDQVFPLLRTQAIHDLGSIPMITWEPWLDDFNPDLFPFNAKAENKNKGGMRAVANGKFDAYIDRWAMDAKKFSAPFFLRWGHEMNDPYRYPWGPQNNAPEDFIAAWQHVVGRFRALGAKNAIWVWSPHPAYKNFESFYPGHQYVDWVGTTAINYGTVATWSQWWSFNEVVGKYYDRVALYKKPVMICEFGSLSVGGDRPAWFAKALDSMPKQFPAVKAVVFYHNGNDKTTTYKTLDWTFRNDPAVLAVIKRSTAGWATPK